MYASLPAWLREIIPIAVLLAVIAFVVTRLPKVDVGHTREFRTRRFWNWFPAGMTYAFLYFGRYNLTAYKNAVGMSNDAYGTIGLWGAIVYGFSFLLNGPLADRIGGRATLLIAAVGSMAMNLAMGFVALGGWDNDHKLTFTVLYALNMYFQSFGAVSIVKVNAAWFHVRERGTFGGIFGILISLGVYFAYDWGRKIAEAFPQMPAAVFFAPPIALGVMAVVDYFLVKDEPSHAGHRDFDAGDARIDDGGKKLSVWQLAKRMLTTRTILIIAAVEFCSGFLRNAIMQWYPVFAKETGIGKQFVAMNWGMLLCCAGIFGGMTAGVISDHVFQSRRGPVSSILYGGLLAGGGIMIMTLETPALGWVVIFMSLCVIGVHGMLSGTASMDFGGKKNVGLVVGIIDGFVYLGTAAQAGILKSVVPSGAAQKDPHNWASWPLAMLPLSFLGLVLATRVWNATARGKAAAH